MRKIGNLKNFSNESAENYFSHKGISILPKKLGFLSQSQRSSILTKPVRLDSSDGLQVDLIHDSQTLNEARNLLYYCYVEKMKWEIKQNNYSGIRIEKVKKKFCLVDDYDSIAIWFSVKQKNQIVACARLCPEDFNRKLELERYPEAQQILGITLKELKNKFHIVELNREAILPHFSAGDFARILLFRKIFEYCTLQKHTIITATHVQDWVNFYNDILFPKLSGLQFKYSNTDTDKVTVYFAHEENIKKMSDKLSFLENTKEVEKC
jgi:hypothetical protein